MLELRAVRKHYNSTLIFEVSALALDNGIYWLQGSNGSGKTTLFKTIVGLVPFEGDIIINNISLKEQPVIYRQKISWAETEPLFPSYMTGMDLIRFYCSVRKVNRNDADTLLEVYNMNDYINTRVGLYSAGMLKKLSIVLAFIGNPDWIILDEPLITLDSSSYNVTISVILEKNKNTNTGFLLSSHQELDNEISYSGKKLLMINKTLINK